MKRHRIPSIGRLTREIASKRAAHVEAEDLNNHVAVPDHFLVALPPCGTCYSAPNICSSMPWWHRVAIKRWWMWTLAFGHHEDRTPTHGYAATREGGNDGIRQKLAARIIKAGEATRHGSSLPLL